jgi:DNA-binding NarL/FixJ family response regulator
MHTLPASRPIRIFLVDDHRTILWGLQRLVESAAPRMAVVGTAESSAALFAALDGADPDLILLDVDLAGENGLDCLPQLGAASAAQVLVLTGARDVRIHHQAIIRGARGVISKNEPAEVILRAIEKVHDGEVWLDRAAMGRVLSAVARGSAPSPEAAKLAQLTPKERQVMAAVVREKAAPNKLIADKLHMSEHTLRNHLTTIYSKLEVDGRMGLYLFATRHANGGTEPALYAEPA